MEYYKLDSDSHPARDDNYPGEYPMDDFTQKPAEIYHNWCEVDFRRQHENCE